MCIVFSEYLMLSNYMVLFRVDFIDLASARHREGVYNYFFIIYYLVSGVCCYYFVHTSRQA